MVRAVLATSAALAVFSAMPAASYAASAPTTAQDLFSSVANSLQLSVPVTVGFEPGLTSAQISQLTAMVPDIIAAQTELSGAAQSNVAPNLTTGTGLARRSCTDQTACYASTCWVPFLGVSCIGCSSISC